MTHVFDTNQQSLTPVYPGWVRSLLREDEAAVSHRIPFGTMPKVGAAHPGKKGGGIPPTAQAAGTLPQQS
jgi:hypothetical protein